YLIARKSQIDQWRENHAVLVQSLVNIIRSRATLMIGLSAQDSNIRSAFAAASATLNWPWPSTFPAIAFSQTTETDMQKLQLFREAREIPDPKCRVFFLMRRRRCRIVSVYRHDRGQKTFIRPMRLAAATDRTLLIGAAYPDHIHSNIGSR